MERDGRWMGRCIGRTGRSGRAGRAGSVGCWGRAGCSPILNLNLNPSSLKNGRLKWFG